MDLQTFTARLDEQLRVSAYADRDPSPNGLQVGPQQGDVEHVALAVDAARSTIDAAVAHDADLLLTHHGLIWDGLDRVTGREYRRLAALIAGDLALYVAHLPLDGHQSLGNAAGIASLLDLEEREPFGLVGEEPVGQRGRLPEPLSEDELAAALAASLDTGEQDVHTLDFGPDRIESLGIVTGAGGEYLDAAVDAGLDALVTGEGKARLYHQARESGLTVVLGGHYATETFGVRQIGAELREWGLTTTYVDHPTGL